MATALIVLLAAAALSATMAFAWFVANRSGRSGWIDAIWSFAVGAGGIVGSLVPIGQTAAISARQLLVAGLAAIWSLRLGLHITARTVQGGDDPRYRQLRAEWGDNYARRLFWFLQMQAVAALLLIISILAAARRPAPGLGFADVAGAIIFAVAVVGETLADRQLSRFGTAPENKGKVCNVGLWAVSRHPNYFFEWLGWVSYASIAVDLGGTYPWGWLSLTGPIFMYWLLVHVSGIPPLETHMLRSRGDRFREYQRRVNAFWPGLPREPRSDNFVEDSQ
jgi:steroid 5-alpha reductase family enzyme